MREEVGKASEQAFTVESRRDETLAQLSFLEESCREQDEARALRDEAQAQCEEARAQREEALARVAVLQQELNKYSEELTSMALAAEESQFQQ